MDKAIENRIETFSALGELLKAYLEKTPTPYSSKIQVAINEAQKENPWFTSQNIEYMLNCIAHQLSPQILKNWLTPFKTKEKTIAIIMAGNIPLVGFHDLLACLLMGCKVIVKPSSKDAKLMHMICSLIVELSSNFKDKINLVHSLIGHSYDALIATGSNASNTQFKKYMQNKPCLFRGHRNAVAILSKDISDEQLNLLAKDVFQYFGMGCRNVSKLFIEQGFDFKRMNQFGLEYQTALEAHNKYMNNYQYYKTIYALNNIAFYDMGFYSLKEDVSLHAMVSVLHYQVYEELSEVYKQIENQSNAIQCVIGLNHVDFGMAQQPKVDQYADQINTLEFIDGI